MDLAELYQDLIMDHGTNPKHFFKCETANCVKEGHNPLCGDKITLYLEIVEGYIKQASFQGSGCAISTASASIMTEMLQGKAIEDVNVLFQTFQNMMLCNSQNTYTEDLGKLMAFSGVKVFPTRIKCATLAWHTLNAALQDDPSLVTTE